MTHITYFWKRNFVYDDIEILSTLPYGIQYDVLKYYGDRIFATFKPFAMLPDTTKGLLAIKLKQFSCNKGFPVYTYGDRAKEFYIQRTGTSVLIIPDKKRKKKDKDKDKDKDKQKELKPTTTNDQHVQHETEEKQIEIEINMDLEQEIEQNQSPNDAEMVHRSLSHIPYFKAGTVRSHNDTNESIDKLMAHNKAIKLDDLQGKRVNITRGDICGHIGFVKGERKGTLYCKTWSEFYSLSKRDLEDVLMIEHPENWEEIMNQIKTCMKSFKPHKIKSNITSSKHQHGHNGHLGNDNSHKSMHGQHKLSINLNESKRRNSKFVRYFTEDSLERDKKILTKHHPISHNPSPNDQIMAQNDFKQEEQERAGTIELTRARGQSGSSSSTSSSSFFTTYAILCLMFICLQMVHF